MWRATQKNRGRANSSPAACRYENPERRRRPSASQYKFQEHKGYRMNSMPRSAQNRISQYRQVGVQTGVEAASPHKLIKLLIDGAIEKVQLARGCLERNEIQRKCETVSWAMQIIDGLRGSLDMRAGGEIAANLDALYDYMLRRLLEANLHNDAAAFDEVVKLLNELRAGWDAIS